jgi:hypothetical protein
MRFKVFLKEGGNAIKSSTRINQENVQATLDQISKKLLPLLGISKSDVRNLGSTGKKNLGSSSGDIDLAVDMGKIIKKEKNVNTVDDVFDFIKDKAKSITHELKDLRSLGVFSIAFPIADGDDPERYQSGEYVQLDIMPTDNLKWVEWSFYSPAEWESKWKGLYRNELIYNIAKLLGYKPTKQMLDSDGKLVDAEWTRYFFNLSTGLEKGIQSRIGKTKLTKGHKTLEKSLVVNDPDRVVEMLFGKGFKSSDILTWEDAIKAFNSPKFKLKDKRKELLKLTKDGLIKKGVPVPEELEKA